MVKSNKLKSVKNQYKILPLSTTQRKKTPENSFCTVWGDLTWQQICLQEQGFVVTTKLHGSQWLWLKLPEEPT